MRHAIRPTSGARILALAAGIASCHDVAGLDQPGCSAPAPLAGTYDSAVPGYIVQYHDGVDPIAETARLEQKYGFTVRYVYTAALHGFAATIAPVQLAGIRCEQSVARVEYDGSVHTQ
jgi:hypothetical protein